MDYKIGLYFLNQDINSVQGLTEFNAEEYKFAESAGMQRVFKEEKWFECDEIDFKDIEWTPTIGSTNGKIYKIALQKEFDNNELNRAFGYIEKCLTSDFGVGSKDTESKIFWVTEFGNILLTKANMYDFNSINLFFTSSTIKEQSNNLHVKKQMSKFVKSEYGIDLNERGDKNKFRFINLLMPITFSLWYLVTFFGLTGVVVSIPFVFSLSWFWLIFTYGIIIGIINILYSISAGVSFGILNLYKFSWVSCIIHSISGIIATTWVFFLYFEKSAIDGYGLFELMWNESIIKTLFVVPAIAIVGIAIIYVMVIVPIKVKTQMKDERY